jgi:hypothetical protein
MGDTLPEKSNTLPTAPEKTPGRLTPWLPLIPIILLVFIAYGASIQNGFVWDDETFIVNNPFVHDLSLWPKYFTVPSVSAEPILSQMYRPLQTLSFALDMRLWDTWAGGFHLTSLLLHCAACGALVYAFRFLVGARPALMAAFIFSVHPALSEGVLSLAARGNQLYTLFGVLSLGLFLRATRPFDTHHVLALPCALLSFCSKEPAIALVALLPLVQVLSGRPWNIRDRRSWHLHLPFLGAAALYLVTRSTVVEAARTVPYWGGSFWATVQMQLKVFVIYLRLLVWPFSLKGRYAVTPPAPFPDPLVMGAMMLNAALIVLGVMVVRRGVKGKLFALAIVWFYVSLLPVANLIPLPGSMMGERFLYFTFAGVIPFLAGSVSPRMWERSRTLTLLLGTGILIVWLATDISRTAHWKNNVTFFSVLAKQEPDNPVVQVRMAQEELAANKVTSALARLERAVKTAGSAPLPADRAKLHYWYGRALLDADRPHDAYREFSLVLTLSPESSGDVLLLLAEAAARSGESGTALRILEGAVKSSPLNDALWNGLGNVLLMIGDKAEAVSSYRRALAINPRNQEAAVNLENALGASRVPSDTGNTQ